MQAVAALWGLILVVGCAVSPSRPQTESPVVPASGITTYSTVHNLRPAHEITRGEGVRVGILDHSFDADVHPELYARTRSFAERNEGSGSADRTHRGYWMALSLSEVAPEAEIYALDTYAADEGQRVRAMVRAIDWAIDEGLDVITSCGAGLTPEARRILDPAVERAVEAGTAVVFLDYDNPLNLLPAGTGSRTQNPPRQADLDILSYDCTIVFGEQEVAFMAADDNGLLERRPFLSTRATAPVAAGLVALVKSADPQASPSEIKRALMDTSRPLMVDGRTAQRVPDAYEAIQRVRVKGA